VGLYGFWWYQVYVWGGTQVDKALPLAPFVLFDIITSCLISDSLTW